MDTLWLLHTAIMLFPLTRQQVIVHPAGSVYIPFNSSINVTCTVVGGELRGWRAVLQNGTIISLVENGELYRGVWIPYINRGDNSSSVAIVNAVDKILVALKCFGEIGASRAQQVVTLNITIYDIPETPISISVYVEDKALTANWSSKIIEKIKTQFNLSLLYICPGEFYSLNGVINNTLSYSFVLDYSRSCNHIQLCIEASNDAGPGNMSCVEKYLPYIPSQVWFMLRRTNESVTAIVNITISSVYNLQDGLYYKFQVTTNQEKETVESETLLSNYEVTFQTTNLEENSYYFLRIISFNGIGMRVSEVFPFTTASNILGIKICWDQQNMLYNFICTYKEEYYSTGCEFHLAGPDVSIINETIVGDDSKNILIQDIMSYNEIRLYNMDQNVVSIKPFDHNSRDRTCGFRTEFVAESTSSYELDTQFTSVLITQNAGLLTAVAVQSCLIAAMIILLTVCAAIIYKRHYPNKAQEFHVESNNAVTCSTNESSGVVTSSTTTTLQCNSNPAYELVNITRDGAHKENKIPYYDMVQLPTSF